MFALASLTAGRRFAEDRDWLVRRDRRDRRDRSTYNNNRIGLYTRISPKSGYPFGFAPAVTPTLGAYTRISPKPWYTIISDRPDVTVRKK